MELRGDGLQTMVPPSVHPSEELVRWHDSFDHIPEVDPDELERRAGYVAFLSIVLNKYPRRRQPGQYLSGPNRRGHHLPTYPMRRQTDGLRLSPNWPATKKPTSAAARQRPAGKSMTPGSRFGAYPRCANFSASSQWKARCANGLAWRAMTAKAAAQLRSGVFSCRKPSMQPNRLCFAKASASISASTAWSCRTDHGQGGRGRNWPR